MKNISNMGVFSVISRRDAAFAPEKAGKIPPVTVADGKSDIRDGKGGVAEKLFSCIYFAFDLIIIGRGAVFCGEKF